MKFLLFTLGKEYRGFCLFVFFFSLPLFGLACYIQNFPKRFDGQHLEDEMK